MRIVPGPAVWPFILLLAAHPLSAQKMIGVSSGRVMPGTEVTLSWRAPGIDSVFIFPLGARPPRGQERIRANSSTTFVIYYQQGGQIASGGTATLVVQGSTRGGDPTPLSYTGTRRYEVTAPSFAQLMERITVLLQDRMGYSIPSARPDRPVIQTPVKERPDLIAPEERETIARRWLAYSVEVAPGPPGRFVCWVSTAIKYKRMLEERVRDQPEGELNRRAAEEFVERLRVEVGR